MNAVGALETVEDDVLFDLVVFAAQHGGRPQLARVLHGRLFEGASRIGGRLEAGMRPGVGSAGESERRQERPR